MYARDHALIATPIGPIRIEGDEETVLRVTLGVAEPVADGRYAAVRAAAEQLRAYFAGELKSFDLPLPMIASARGQVLRDGLVALPYGETASYGELARRLDSGPRAIGQLCARNSLPVIIPCHRVTAAGGALGSYSAGDGPATKKWLLDHEQRHA
ncbi:MULTISPECIES: methylated-DNA--[protein]-cysteine S-methyltransferase [unclassified Sphingomonas]|uniref:methylated-DNA--[protein]-cysteine S-methyltransferase n=1 Tax=unclassified Sphingomonas TaxID=196159 RepID=UPI00215074CB|nr:MULTISPECIES: methylated-DNA--[protein]-cysteine S-methyltransferase [unclassified Sphingomonas]MCR5870420.1 methylated-DNA--[protein]-cysteine S-methyltransferase [Sphingomonas sp. J344]UUY01233.1 methylated-DNA--[protein]-cysteine S-methyltransferase [Sphingomonas sp. J315]